MLEKLAKQTAIYGISTIVVRFLSYLLSPFYTWWLSREEYGVITDIYALIPFALVVLTMGMESSYFRFAGRADEAGGDVAAAKRHLFATTWGATLAAASVFLLLVVLFRGGVARLMGDVYVAHPQYVVLAAAIIFFDVAAMIPFARLRERGEAERYVMLKALGVCINVALVFAFAAPLMRLFVDAAETEVIREGVRYLRIEGAFYAGIGCLFLFYGLYRAVGRPGMSVVLTVVSLGTRVVLAYALSAIPAIGVTGIWWSVPIGWFLADAVGGVYYWMKKKALFEILLA